MTRILFTTQAGATKQTYFPPELIARLERLGEVVFNANPGQPFSEDQLRAALPGVDVCLTHWGCPTFTPAVLENADRLSLIAHAAGSVADLVTPAAYERGIRVCSANRVMARFVAESVLAYMLAGLKYIPLQVERMRSGGWGGAASPRSLYDACVSLIGLGAIGRYLLDLLAPFQVQVKVYDPYLKPGALAPYPRVESASLDEALAWGDVVSIHAALTPETRGMLDAGKLALIRDGALLVNTARGPIVDEAALVRELQSGRIQAALDVYTVEPLPAESPLRGMQNVLLFPHTAGLVDRGCEMSVAMLDEIERFIRGEALQYEIPFEQFRLMTREREFKIYTG